MALSLSFQRRADLYVAWHQLFEAGLAADRAIRSATANERGPLRAAALEAAAAIGRGTPLSEAGRRSGLLPETDARLLGSAETTGNLGPVLRRLSSHYGARASRWRRLRGRMLYPLLILVIAVFVGPLPALVAGSIGPGGYAVRTLLPALALALAIAVGRLVVARIMRGAYPVTLARSFAALPLVSTLVEQRARTELLQGLSLFLSCGVPAFESYQGALANVSNPILRQRFARGARLFDSGGTVAEVLREGRCFPRDGGFALIAAGEAAGKLDDTLERYASSQAERLDELADHFATWAPRVVYILVVGYVAGALLS